MAIRPKLQVIVDDRDITGQHDGLTFSNVDPGGFEALTLNPRGVEVKPGMPVTVRYGMEWAWHGLVNEAGQHDRAGRAEHSIAALGYGQKLKDPIRRLYVDRDLSRWGSPSTTRQLGIAGASQSFAGPADVTPDDAGSPRLRTKLTGPWLRLTICDGLYNAQGLDIGSVYWAFQANANISAADANWIWAIYLDDADDVASILDNTGDLSTGSSGSGTLTAGGAGRRFATVNHYYQVAAGGNSVDYAIFWNLAVYGTHGLTKRGSAPSGFYTSDIVSDAVAGLDLDLVIEPNTDYTVAHSTYLQPTPREQIVDDMAKLAGGWHWGVWEPRSILGVRPMFMYREPPSAATVSVNRADCDEIDAPKVRLDQLYNTAIVSYRDPAGSSGYATVTISNPLLAAAGVGSRTIAVDAGLASAASAQAIGTFTLDLALLSARGGGWAILPDTVTLAAGGRKPACLLKAGRDRIRINDLPQSGVLVGPEAQRYDTFRIRRVETTADENGVPRTRIEFDGGADLLEVLNARLAIASVLAGA